MRIGLITYGLDRPLTGISRYTLELGRALAQLPDVELVLLSAGGAGLLAHTGIEQTPLSGCSRLPGLLTLGHVVIPEAARRMRLDLVHDPTGVTPLLFGAGVPIVSTVHDIIPITYPGNSSRLDTLIYQRWLPFQLRRINAVITVSRYSQADILRHMHLPAERLHVVLSGVRAHFHPVDAAEAQSYVQTHHGITHPYVLYLGNLTQRKNLSLALRGFARVCETYPDLRFVLVGPSTFRQTPIGQMADALGIADRVIVTGPVADESLPPLLSGAQVFVFPSLYEGFGLPVLEAMACGAPVITSNTTSLPEVTGDAAILIDPSSDDEMADALRRVLTDSALRADLRVRGIDRAREFTWQRTALETAAVYRSVLAHA